MHACIYRATFANAAASVNKKAGALSYPFQPIQQIQCAPSLRAIKSWRIGPARVTEDLEEWRELSPPLWCVEVAPDKRKAQRSIGPFELSPLVGGLAA